MEFVAKKTIKPLTGDPTKDILNFSIPHGFATWTLHILPVDSNPGVNNPIDPVADLLYGVNGAYQTINGQPSLICKVNQDTVVTRSDAVATARLKFTAVATFPDGGVVVELHGIRKVSG